MVQPNSSHRHRIGGRKTRWRFLVTGLIAAVAILSWAYQASLTPALVIPPPTMPVPNAFDYFDRAGSLTADHNKVDYALAISHTHPSHIAHSAWPGLPTGTRPSSLDPDDHVYSQSEKASLLSDNAAALRQLRQGFAFPYVNPPIRSFWAKTPYYSHDGFLARLLTLEAQVKAGSGDWGGAIDSDLDAVQLGVALSHGSPLMGLRRGIDCQDIGRMAAWPIVTHLTARQAMVAAHRIETVQAGQADFGGVLQEDEWMTQASLQEMMRSPDWKSQYADMEWYDDNPRLLRLRLALTTKRSLIADYTQVYDSTRQHIRSPYHRDTPPSPSLLEPMTGDLEFDLQALWFLDTANRAQNSLLTATLALQAYRQEHGDYPASLAALAPVYLSRIPTDPFDAGHPLRYRPLKAGYLLYSIGPDGRDDGGTPVVNVAYPVKSIEQPKPRYIVDPSSLGDIVAGINIAQPLRGSM